GAASMDFGGRKAAATAAGLIDGVQYLIAGPLVGVGMGRLLDTYGWSVWQFAPLPFALAGALLMSRLWNALPAARLAAGRQARGRDPVPGCQPASFMSGAGRAAAGPAATR